MLSTARKYWIELSLLFVCLALLGWDCWWLGKGIELLYHQRQPPTACCGGFKNTGI